MPEPQTTAIAVRAEAVRTSVFGVFQSTGRSLVRVGTWAGDVAQEFGTLLSDLLGPAVFSVYCFAAWSLAASFGWTDSFIFTSGPLANWIVWLGIAILLNLASSILKRRVRNESSQS